MSTTYTRPGVFVNETLGTLPSGSAPPATAIVAFVAAATRGSTTPVLVDSWAAFNTLFGSFADSAYLALAVYAYFQNGGTPCYVLRVAHSDAVSATRSTNDQGSTAQPTLSLTAVNPGTWGNGITFDITASYVDSRFNLIVHYGGTQVEQFVDLTMESTDPRYAPVIINASSQYVIAADLHSENVAPDNEPLIQSGTALATGVDGGAAVASDFTAALATIGSIAQPVLLNLPGVSDSTILAASQSWVAAADQSNVFQVIDPAPSSDVATVLTFSASLTPTSYGAGYYPWVVISDPSRPLTSASTVAIPPGGPVLAKYVATDSASGPFQTPAGTNVSVKAVGLQTTLATADYSTLNSANPPVNAIKPIPGYGICVFGGRTLQPGFPSLYVAIRRSLIYIEQALRNATQFAVFKPNDPALWSTIDGIVTAWLTDYWGQGGLFGQSANEAFFVTCDSTNNTPTSIQSGVVNITVGVALEYPAEFVVINIGQYQGGATTTNTLTA